MASQSSGMNITPAPHTPNPQAPVSRGGEPPLPLWKAILKNLFYIFAVFNIVIFCLFILENSRLWKSAKTTQTGPYQFEITRTPRDTAKTEVRYLAPQEYYWLIFLEKVTMIGLPTMFIIGILLQWGLKIMIVPGEDDTYPRLE
ncbi:MAG: hypothetical protein Kow0059_02090 [Candidatus Sumerlaeia bacterium]